MLSKILLVAGTATILLLSCNNDTRDKEASQQDTTTAHKPPPPPPQTLPPGVEMAECFRHEGLKYTVTVSLIFLGDSLRGTMISEDAGAGIKEEGDFSGTVSGNKLAVQFKANKPTVGDASEWTTEPWTLNRDSKALLITFNAKNYETNKWEKTMYEFMQAACK